MDNLLIIQNYTKQVGESVRKAYSFMSDDAEKFAEIGAEYTIGKKFAKVIIKTGQKSVHAFVDMNTLDLYKAESWNKPAKGIRFNLRNDADKLKQILQTQSAYCGGYLYK